MVMTIKLKFFACLIFACASGANANEANIGEVLGDLSMPPAGDVSQKFPYGITQKTPPHLTKVNYESQKPYHKYRIQLRVFQGCPQIEISEGGRLWASWFGSNVQSERSPLHQDQFSVIATSGDDGATWKEVYIFDPSRLLDAGASDPMLWKDAKGNIRFACVRNMKLSEDDTDYTTSWEFTMNNPEYEFAGGWSAPRYLGNKNMSVMKPLIMPDGGVLRPMDDFKAMKNRNEPRIRFLREDAGGKPLFVSETADPDATFVEQMPIIRKDGSLFSFYRTKRGQKFMESFDGGKTWKLGGHYPMQFSIDTKCFLKTLPSGKVLLIANDVQMRGEDGKKFYYHTDENGKEVKEHGARRRMTAYLSDDDCKTFSKKFLLCGDGALSYPAATLGKDGAIYIVYDQGRATIGQHTIFLSKITEEDILAGKLVSKGSFLNRIVIRPSDHGGGRREGDTL